MSEEAAKTTETTTATDLSNADSQAQEIPGTEDIRSESAKSKPEELYDFDEPGDDIPTGEEDTTKGGEDIPAKGAEETTRTKGKEKEVDAPTFSDELLARAEKLGLSKEEVADFGTEEAANKALTLFEKKSTATGTQTEQKPDSDANKNAATAAFKKYEVKLDPNVFDPEIIETVNGINEHYSKQFEAMEGQLNEARQSLNRQQALQFEQQFDGWIKELGDGYKDVLGDGRGAEMDKKSEQFGNRVKVLDEMETIAAGFVKTGKQVPPYGELFEKALASVFKDKQKEIARKEISGKLGKRQIIARPSQRRGGNVDPEAAARSYVKSFLEDHDTAEPSTAIDF
jgi:hypothetical protein